MLYIVPSRGRPDNARELVKAWEATRTFAHLWVCVDNDDPALAGYQDVFGEFSDDVRSWATLWVGPRLRLGPTINFYVKQYLAADPHDRVQTPPGNWGDMVGFMGDDHRPRTIGWDIEIVNAGCNGSHVVYGNDLIQGRNLPTAVAMTVDIPQTLGYFVPPGVIHLFADNAWLDMGRATRLAYLDNVVIEHCHPVAQKGVEWDDGYVEVNSQEQWSADEAAYSAWSSSGYGPGGWREKLYALTAVSSS